MNKKLRMLWLAGSSVLGMTVFSTSVAAAPDDTAASATPQSASPSSESSSSGQLEEVVVTATKRRQSLNEVPLSVTALRGDELVERGVMSTADLAKLVPGLTAEPSPFNTPIYTLRGVGFYDSTLSAPPTVAVYTDEVPLPYSAMTKQAGLDLERVEVLKGPQGTLFGNNTTGGAINYIAAKPTDQFAAGFSATVGRFAQADVQGFVSGPVTGDINMRLSALVNSRDTWQHSITTNASLGAVRTGAARLLADWKPSDDLKIALNVNGWLDNSDSQAPQRVATYISVPGNPQAPATIAYPYPSLDNQSADWSTNLPALQHHDSFIQAALRADYTLNDAVTLTSITALERYSTNSYDDFDGTARNIADNHTKGYINTVSQELRAAGKTDKLNWVAGGNFEADGTYDRLYYYFGDSTTSQVASYHMTYTYNDSKQDVKTGAAFANAEYKLTDDLTFQGGARYTLIARDFTGCTYDIPGGGVAQTFDFLETAFRNPALPFVPVPPGGCITFDSSFAPFGAGAIHQTLDEHNFSWRTGLSYKTINDGLIYITFAQGYKGGSFPTTSASTINQYRPVRQESLLAYEGGFKQPLLDRRLQVNGSFFYYDYGDKQLSGRILDPTFGPLTALVQIPKSHVIGGELEVDSRPFPGLTLSVATTYLHTRIDEFVGYNNAGVLNDYAGSSFPYAPSWQIVGAIDYEWSLGNQLGVAFVGTNFTYNSKTQASIGDLPQLRIASYGLLDLRAGFRTDDDRWTFELWGRNVLNKYYWTNALQSQDVYVRYTGLPATYGGTITYRFE